MRSYLNVPPDSMSDLAIASATRALALDSTLGDAHAVLGYALMSRVQPREAERSYLRAIELDPANPHTRHWHAINLNGLGLVDSAYAEAVRAETIDPMSAVFANHRAITLLFMGRLPEAVAHWKKAIELDSTFSTPYRNLASAYILSGTPDSAVKILDRQGAGTSGTPVRGSLYLRAYAVLGRWADLDRLVAAMRARGMSATEDMSLALANGDHQAAIDALERGLTARGGLIYDIVSPGCDPILQPLHGEPRYHALMARLGIRVCTIRTPWPATRRPSGAVR
jgi:Flp pilus assembly protein TadD